jgi:hypothetical protein
LVFIAILAIFWGFFFRGFLFFFWHGGAFPQGGNGASPAIENPTPRTPPDALELPKLPASKELRANAWRRRCGDGELACGVTTDEGGG